MDYPNRGATALQPEPADVPEPDGAPDRSYLRVVDEAADDAAVTLQELTHRPSDPSADPLATLARAFDRAQDVIELLDANGQIVYVNRAYEEFMGLSLEAVRGLRPYAPGPDGSFGSDNRKQLGTAVAKRSSWRGVLAVRGRDRHSRPFDFSLTPVQDDSAQIVNFVGIWRPSLVGSRTPDPGEEVLTRKISSIDLALEGCRDGLWDADVTTGQLWMSRRLNVMLGWGTIESSAPIAQVQSLFIEEDVPRLVEAVRKAQGRDPYAQADVRLRLTDGSLHWFALRAGVVRDPDGKIVRLSGSARNITRRKRAEKALQHAAYHDELTGLPNRSLFHQRLEKALDRLKRTSRQFAVLFIDLNRFKLVNDSAGHHVGDQLLSAISDRLRHCVRPGDTLARLGGDEFALLIESLGKEQTAMTVSGEIHERLSDPFSIEDLEFYSSASIGIAFGSPAQEDAEEVLQAADTAMYQAKERGPGGTVVFNPGMLHRARARLELETDMRRALERGEFSLAYQPLVRLVDGAFIGYEALIRWKHPRRGRISPAEFIPVAEETGLVVDIGRWVMAEATKATARLRAALPNGEQFKVSVNMAPQHLAEPTVVSEVTAALLEAGLPPQGLRLEITERTTVGETNEAAQTLQRFRALGVAIDIDDFGTGYSSLSYLTQLPLDTVKIDGSFVRRLGSSTEAGKLILAIVRMSHSLDLSVTAEGIENLEQLDILRRLGCDKGQGFLFSQPLNLFDLEALLARGTVW